MKFYEFLLKRKYMRVFFVVFGVFIYYISFSQVTFVIESLPENTPQQDLIYIAGSMNNWVPDDPDFLLKKNENNKWEIQLEAQAEGSALEFKFTRGSWETVEKDAGGNDIANRSFIFGNNEIVEVEIASWADISIGNSTAADNVSIMDEDFYMLQLDRNRRIWIYLPPGYEQNTQSYPVLYMHDGQNLFDVQTSFAGEWEIDETLNELAASGKNVPIVVGIDNGGGHRMDEYSAWINVQYGGGEGDAYIRFISETLKPYIDENYRTKPEAINTGIMGSSLGGFIAQYAVFQYSDVFGKAGLFSPSYWYSDSVWAFTEEYGNYASQKVYQLVGSLEGGTMTNDMNKMHNMLLEQGFTSEKLKSKEVQGQGHNEAFWRSEFGKAYLWLFSDFASGIDKIENSEVPLIYPNPASDYLFLGVEHLDSLLIFNSSGELIIQEIEYNKSILDINSLSSGLYFIEIKIGNKIRSSKFLKL